MTNLKQILEQSLNQLLTKNDPTMCLSIDFGVMVSQETINLIQRQLNWSQEDIEEADIILHISNILYNNSSVNILPLDDGLYDQLLVAYKRYNPNSYQVGAEPMLLPEAPQQEFEEKKRMYTCITDQEYNSSLYTHDIVDQHTRLNEYRPVEMMYLLQEPITKRLINTKHKYPELVGTLDKCKFVLNAEAADRGAIDNPAVQVFERDFIQKHIFQGVIDQYREFDMIGELKYDGVSVEAEVCGDRIISAYSRGDTGEDIATDLTPIFRNYNLYRAKNVPNDIPFGIKFEAVLTHRNLELLGQMRGKEYKNGRNAIIGLLGASDAYKYTNMITLIPISTSFDMNRVDELNFLNKYYSTGEFNRFVQFHGNYISILYQVQQFTQSAELVRKVLPYMIDGVVISYTDKNIINLLGRVNSVNKYQMAIKFNPRSVRTIFLGYTYNIGKSGEIIPMVHFKPAEFIGTIHTKQTIHSLQRFNELSLIKGQEIDVDYVNDVISYVTKPDTAHNRQLQAQFKPEPFIQICPYCGSRIEISDTGKSARCPNVHCHERKIMRMVDMISRLGFKDFSEETVRALDLTDFKRLVQVYDYSELESKLGPVTADKFRLYQHNLINDPIEDYKIMAALSFEGMAEEKWKIILKVYDLYTLAHMDNAQLHGNLIQINGIGPAIINAIICGFEDYREDIEYVVNNMKIINSKDLGSRPKVALTGTRDEFLMGILNSIGFDCSDKYGVTKDTALLVTTDLNSTSGKMDKARKYGIPIMTPQMIYEKYGIEVTTF